MNIAMEQTEEHVNGVVTNRYGDAFIRGNNGLYPTCLTLPPIPRAHLTYPQCYISLQGRGFDPVTAR